MIVGMARVSPPAGAPLPRVAAGPAGSGPVPAPRSGPPAPEYQTGLPASSIRIPTLGVTATIGPAAEDDGVLIPPRVPTEVGLWAGSADLGGASGEVTLAGHVNWAGMPPFAFGRLADLQAGDLVYTADAHGAQTAWRVTAVTARSKAAGVDPAGFAGPTGSRRLALITCGGPFDSTSYSYDDNVYAFAVPA
jgi:sortase (surface protein transpeptidase)